jgi:hypothetical protein
MQSLDFIWKFPIIGQELAHKISPNVSFDWAILLRLAVGTDEFNNPSALLPLSSESTKIGMFAVLFVLAFSMSRLHGRMVNGDAMSLLIYACLALGLFELPLVFWFSLGKTLPVYLALVWLVRAARDPSKSGSFPITTYESS